MKDSGGACAASAAALNATVFRTGSRHGDAHGSRCNGAEASAIRSGSGQDGVMHPLLAPSGCPILVEGSEASPATLLLAHGAGAPMDSPFQASMAAGLAARGWRVVRFEFPYMARSRETGRRHGPDRMPVLQEAFRQLVQWQRHQRPQQPLVVGGKSMGGRVASLLVDSLAQEQHSAAAPVLACLCLGYPFHPPGKPQQLRSEHLRTLQTPTLIVQGERDPFGRRQEVEAYTLSHRVQLQWIPSGDHSFQPSRSSGLSELDTWAMAVEGCDAFLKQLLNPGTSPTAAGSGRTDSG